MYIYLFYVCMCHTAHVWGSEEFKDNSQSCLLLPPRIPGIKPRWSRLAASTFTHEANSPLGFEAGSVIWTRHLSLPRLADQWASRSPWPQCWDYWQTSPYRFSMWVLVIRSQVPCFWSCPFPYCGIFFLLRMQEVCIINSDTQIGFSPSILEPWPLSHM